MNGDLGDGARVVEVWGPLVPRSGPDGGWRYSWAVLLRQGGWFVGTERAGVLGYFDSLADAIRAARGE